MRPTLRAGLRAREQAIEMARDGFDVPRPAVSRGDDRRCGVSRRDDGRFDGFTEVGTMRIVCLRQAATENAVVYAALLENPRERGADTGPRPAVN